MVEGLRGCCGILGVFFHLELLVEMCFSLESTVGIQSFMCACMLGCSDTLDSWWPCGLLPTRLLCPWNFPGENTGVGCHFLLQGIFPIRDQIHVSCASCIAGRFFTTGHLGSPRVFYSLYSFLATDT